MEGYDAILVLGGGVREGGALPPWVAARFDLALQRESGEPIVCLSAGTVHRPPPLEHGFPVLESVAGARYLMDRGVAPERIRVENASYDTVGNAYLAKLLFVDPAGWRRLLIITSEYHMPRSKAIFDWVFGLEPDRYALDYAATEDVGLTGEQWALRRRVEARNLEALKDKIARYRTPEQLRDWFWTGHRAYSAEGLRRRVPPAREIEGIY